MPRDVDVDFLAIDEVQLAADPERGHVFTDRLLHARGRQETLLLGAQTMREAIADLIPGANFISRPRLSKLTYAGEKKITRLPPRTAVVAFSAAEVYAIAELIRRQRGGAAVVLGALSPAHAQRAGGALPVGRRRLPGGHRRHRHGPQPRRRPRRLRRRAQVRRPGASRPDAGRARPDRRPRRPPHERRHVRRHRRASSRSMPTSSSGWRRTPSTPCKSLQWRNRDLDFALARPAARQPARDAARAAPRARAHGRRHRRAGDRQPRSARSPRWPRRRPPSAGCGTSARSPTTARSRRRTTPSWWPRSTSS